MGQNQSLAIPRVIPEDWKRLDLIVNKIKLHLGRQSSPTFAGLDLTGITDGRVPYMSASGFADGNLYTDGTQVGIGITPVHQFHVHKTVGSCTQFLTSGNGQSNIFIGATYPGTPKWAVFAVDTSGNLHLGASSNPGTDQLVITSSGAVSCSGAITTANYTAANLLTAAASNAGELDFTAGSKKLDVEDNAVVDQDYSSDASPTFAGLTLTNAAVISSDSVVFQPNTDSTTFLQVLDADGGTPIFNVDSTNERVGIGTATPSGILHLGGADQRMYLGTSGFFVLNRGDSSSDIYFGENADTGDWIFRTAGDVVARSDVKVNKLYLAEDATAGTYNVFLQERPSAASRRIMLYGPAQSNAFGFIVSPTDTTSQSNVFGLWDRDFDNAGVSDLAFCSFSIRQNTGDMWIDLDEIGSVTLGDINFRISGGTKVIIKNDGKLGIGTTSPSALLEISKDSANTTFLISCYHDTETTTPLLVLRKADGTEASPALVDDNAILGTVQFNGHDGSGFHAGAKIEARIQGTPSDGADMPTELSFWTTSDGDGSPLQRVTIDRDGFVGINQVAPICFLDIGESVAGTELLVRAYHTNNTNTGSGCRFQIRTGGANGGDPYFQMGIVGEQSWGCGIDNSDSDKFKITRSASGASPSSGDVVLTLTTASKVGFSEADPETFTEWTSAAPYLTIHNETHEDTDGGRESRINFKGEQSGSEETTLARIEVGHDGSADDEKGKIIISTNDGNDTNTPTTALTINSGQIATFAQDIIVNGFLELTQKAGTTTDGDLWNDSTQEALQTFVSGIEQTLVGVIFTQTADKTIANTTTETTLFGTGVGILTLPANFWVVGKTIRIEIHGDFADTGNPTVEIQTYYGATSLIDSGAIALSGLGGTEEWECLVVITCRSTGVSGTVETIIDWEYETTTGSSAIERLDVSGVLQTIDTTASGTLDVTFQWGTAAAANTLISEIAFVEVLN